TLTDQGTVLFEADAMKALKEGSANVLGPEGQVATDVLKSTYFTVTELNEMIGPLVERLAKEHDVVLPRNWNGQVFKTNPLDIVFGYVNNLDEVVTSWNLMDALRTAGLAFEHSTAPNTQDRLQAMYRKLMRNWEEVEVPARVHVKLTPEEDELARRGGSNWAFDSTKLRQGVAAAIRRGDEAMAPAEPKAIPA